jgi:hypothetical protein
MTPCGEEVVRTPEEVPRGGFNPKDTPEAIHSVGNPAPTRYLEAYDEPSANIILVGSDGVGLRVHDYYLKAARSVRSSASFHSDLTYHMQQPVLP